MISRVICTLLLLPALAKSQGLVDGDLTLSSREISHGRVVSSDPTALYRAWLFKGFSAGELSVGGSALTEFRTRGRDALLLRGEASRGISRVDTWAEGRLHAGAAEVVTGYVDRRYTVREPLSLPYDDRHQLYFGIESGHETPIIDQLRLGALFWRGVDKSPARVLELSAGHELLIAPLNDLSASLDVRAGADYSAPSHQKERAWQYVDARLGFDFSPRCDHHTLAWRFFPEIGLHMRWGLTPSAQRVTRTKSDPQIPWVEFNFWPGNCARRQ